EVAGVAGSQGPERRRLERVGHEGDREAVLVEPGDRQRDAVDGDRALLDAVAEELGRRVDPDRLAARAHAAEAVDVTLHEVAAERLARTERRLEGDAVARLQRTECRARKRIVDAVERALRSADRRPADAVD